MKPSFYLRLTIPQKEKFINAFVAEYLDKYIVLKL